MKRLCLLVAAFACVSCESCEEVFQDIKKTCEATPSTKYLVSVRSVDYDGIGTSILSSPVNHNVEVCNDHFPANTQAGHQYNAAVDEINRIEGSKLHFTTTRSGITHRAAADLFPSSPSASHFDYVDVNASLPNKCSLQTDLSFAMRTCRFDKTSGETNYFNILVHSGNYGHFSDPSSDDYPNKHGILHELAHAFGMKHTPNWDTDDKKYISTMQGNLEYLSAVDVAYLRHNYSKSVDDHRNYVASSLTRFNETKGKFSKQNPSKFYVTNDGFLKDCDTKDDPFLYAAWFNTGNVDGESDVCGVNRFYLRKKADHDTTIPIKKWKFATMPYLSQDQWKGDVEVEVDDPGGISFSSEWELAFETNAWGTLDESTTEDNIVSMDVELYDGSCTP